MKIRFLLGAVVLLTICGGVSLGSGGDGIYTADVEMTLPNWYGEPFMATINPDSHVPEASKNFFGFYSGPVWNPTSIMLLHLPVYAINAVGIDELDGPPFPGALLPPKLPEYAEFGDSLYATSPNADYTGLETDFDVRAFGWSKVGELTMSGTNAGGGTFNVHGSFSEVFGNNYPVFGTIGLQFPGPDWSAGPNDFLWVGVGNIDLFGGGISIQSGDPRWEANPVVLEGGDPPDDWRVEGTNGWPGATLDKFFFGAGTFDVNTWVPRGSAQTARSIGGFDAGGFDTTGLPGRIWPTRSKSPTSFWIMASGPWPWATIQRKLPRSVSIRKCCGSTGGTTTRISGSRPAT